VINPINIFNKYHHLSIHVSITLTPLTMAAILGTDNQR